jgi:predicted 3-demethylubiquinone-9 3-methyltransferase (glyoxalase superfamily)
MANSIYPCFWFDNQGQQAAEFYCSIFNNANITASNPIVTEFTLNGFKVMALNGGAKYSINPAISLFVNCNNMVDVNQIWDKLIVGGKAMIDIGEYDWSKRYGWLQDKFGVTWQISYSENPEHQQHITTALLFTSNVFGQAKAAMDFYCSIFKEAGITQHIPYTNANELDGKTLYAEFNLHNTPFIAMDGPGEHQYTFGEGVSLVVNCDTQEEIDHYWHSLSAVPQAEQCGWLKDKFGISWQIVPSILGKLMSDPTRATRVTEAFLKMKKFEIETLLNA